MLRPHSWSRTALAREFHSNLRTVTEGVACEATSNYLTEASRRSFRQVGRGEPLSAAVDAPRLCRARRIRRAAQPRPGQCHQGEAVPDTDVGTDLGGGGEPTQHCRELPRARGDARLRVPLTACDLRAGVASPGLHPPQLDFPGGRQPRARLGGPAFPRGALRLAPGCCRLGGGQRDH